MHRLDRTDRRVIAVAFIIALVFACAAAIIHEAGAQEPCTATAPELPTVPAVNQGEHAAVRWLELTPPAV